MHSNESELQTGNVMILAALRGSSGVLCAVINAILLMSIFFRSDRARSIHRLLMYICLSSLLALLVNVAQIVSIGCESGWHVPTCVVVGFAQQFTAWLLMLNVIWLVCLISLHYWFPSNHNLLTPKKDVIVWLVIIVISLAPSLVPVGTGAYGMNKAWCWIQTARVAEQWVYWYVWLIIVGLMVIVQLCLVLWYSETRVLKYYEASRGINDSKERMGRTEANKIKTLIMCVTVYLVGVCMMVILYQISHLNNSMALLVVVGVSQPVSFLAVPLVLVTLLHSAKKASGYITDHTYSHYGDKENSVRSINSSYTSDNGLPKKKRPGRQQHSSGKKAGFQEHTNSNSLLVTDPEKSDMSTTN